MVIYLAVLLLVSGYVWLGVTLYTLGLLTQAMTLLAIGFAVFFPFFLASERHYPERYSCFYVVGVNFLPALSCFFLFPVGVLIVTLSSLVIKRGKPYV
ncbi:MAG: hypothetical protein ACKO7W_04725 [Elainella sp.]